MDTPHTHKNETSGEDVTHDHPMGDTVHEHNDSVDGVQQDKLTGHRLFDEGKQQEKTPPNG